MFGFLKWFSVNSQNDDKNLQDEYKNRAPSFAKPENIDGAIEQTVQVYDGQYITAGGINQTIFNPINEASTTAQLINTYRNLAQLPEVDNAIDEIVKDAIVQEDYLETVLINLQKTTFSESIQQKIEMEFENILNLYNFRKNGHKLFRKWYVDSRIYFHKIIDGNEIIELRLLNPKKLAFHRDIITTTQQDGVGVVKALDEYFIYDDLLDQTCSKCNINTILQKLKISKNDIVYAHSGLFDACDNIIGYLHRAIKLANMLTMLEDALVIYRVVRAPERRVFYIDTGNMPPKMAEQHVTEVMNRTKNKIVFDSLTGKLNNQFNNLSIADDYFLTRKNGADKTAIETLSGALDLGETGDLDWINKKLYTALRIPVSRIPKDGGVVFGGSQEITRDELSFTKFIRNLRIEFSEILLNPLKTNLINKKIITDEEWDENKNQLRLVYASDSYFDEVKDLQILSQRINALNELSPYIGKYFSNSNALKNIFKMSQSEIDEELEIIRDEKNNNIFDDNVDEE